LQFIPPYSPNLNLIERVWKFVKGELRSKYYDDFSEFQRKINSIIDSTSKENLPKMKKLIGEKVQLFDDMKPITENTFESLSKQKKTAA
jgi:transposase